MNKKELAKKPLFGVLLALGALVGSICNAQSSDADILEENKRIARGFYDDLWFSNNTDKYGLYVADTYVVHDIGERKNATEQAIEQKKIADFFWENGTLSGDIHYQIAEGDLVATRWSATFEPQTMVGKFLIGKGDIPIVNVLRIEDGKIVEFWNHRHDIDTPQTLKFTIKGFLSGLLVALLPLLWALNLRRRLRVASAS